VDKQNIGVALFTHLHRFTRTNRHGLNRVTCLFLEQWDEHIEQS
jgi:hypothetical protein